MNHRDAGIREEVHRPDAPAPFDRALEVRRRIGTSEFTLQKMRCSSSTPKRLSAYLKAGVRIAMGTDMALDPEMAANAQELEIYVDYGMTSHRRRSRQPRKTPPRHLAGKVTGTLTPESMPTSSRRRRSPEG